MTNTYQIYLISDSTGETLDRIFLALKAQFLNIEYKVHSYSFTRTENQILKILEEAEIKPALDTQGSQVRVAGVDSPVEIKKGDQIILHSNSAKEKNQNKIRIGIRIILDKVKKFGKL